MRTLTRSQQITVRQTAAFQIRLMVSDGMMAGSVVMNPEQARELAFMLNHAASEAEFAEINMKITAWKASITANTNN